jgi:hypothetical protein
MADAKSIQSGHKSCKRCGAVKPLEAFHAERRNRDGRTADCIPCERERKRASVARQAASVRKRKAEWSAANRETHRRSDERWRRTNPEKIAAKNARRPPEEPPHLSARNQVNAAIRRGELHRPSECSQCGRCSKVYGHHPDYQRPLDVIWLCASCHRNEHIRLASEPTQA